MKNFTSTLVAASILALGFGIGSAGAESHGAKKSNMQEHGKMEHGKSDYGKMKYGTMDHSKMYKNYGSKDTARDAEGLPLEPGQGAFATIAEIVVMLTNDPATDWDKVNIGALREHLIDMDEVALRASAKTTLSDDKIVFTVTGSGRTKQAIQTMVPAHAAVLTRTTAWDAKGELTDEGATMTIVSNKPIVLKVINALGFYGVMATGAHHQAHHLAMAKGDSNVHAHN